MEVVRPITVIYNLEPILNVSRLVDTFGIPNTIQLFIEEIMKRMPIPRNHVLKLFLAPAQPLDAPDYVPFQNPDPSKEYRDDGITGVLWVESGDTVAEHFPYSIWFSGTSISFDAGPPENPPFAAQVVHDVIRDDNHTHISAMTNPQDLVTRFILPLLPNATPRSII